MVGAGGGVLFLVPSIQLLSQSLREWAANAEVGLRPFAVCSDVKVGRKAVSNDEADISTIDLAEPAPTDAATLLKRMSIGRHAKNRMTVVFSTYQSIDVIINAQAQGLPEFDLVICDEAHRTTGVTLAGKDESAFVKVHDGAKLKAAKRLYMTATPRVFGDAVTKKAIENNAVLADMGNEATFGPELHRLGFAEGRRRARKVGLGAEADGGHAGSLRGGGHLGRSERPAGVGAEAELAIAMALSVPTRRRS